MAANLTKLTFASLGLLDGRLEPLLEKHVVGIANDCINRPADKTPRKVILEFVITPICDPMTNECDDVDLVVECKSKVPVYHTPGYRCRVTRGGLGFNADSPENPDQKTLFTQESDDEE